MCKFLSDCGFEIVYPELLSFEQQIAIFINAKVIIGPHGSAFTNIIFSEHAKVIEFFGTRVPLNFYCYSLIMGHKYKPLFCKDSGELNSNIFVEINELKNLLDSF